MSPAPPFIDDPPGGVAGAPAGGTEFLPGRRVWAGTNDGVGRIVCIPVDTPGLFRIRRRSGQIVETVVVAKYVRLGEVHGHGLCDFLVRHQEREVTVAELKREWGEDSVELMDAARFIDEWARGKRERRGSA